LREEPIAVGAERFCNGDHALDDAPWVEPLQGGKGRGNLDAGSARPIVVEILGAGL
jgi:hypothetical protein